MVQFLKSRAEQAAASEGESAREVARDAVVEKSHGAVEAAPAQTARPQQAQRPELPTPPAPRVPVKDPILFELEGILAEGLGELYGKMLPSEQAAFKKKGEEVAQKIKDMVDRAKLRAYKVLVLIRDWLRMIPDVTRFFLEQEAKIKTDRIMEHAESKKILE